MTGSNAHDDASDFMDFVAASPSPRHAVASSVQRLEAAGFSAAPSAGSDRLTHGYRARAGSLLAWRISDPTAPLRVICAHTDSPNLRIKPQPDSTNAGYTQLGVEVYGGALYNSWLDRDLGLAGHVALRSDSPSGIETQLVDVARPVLRIPQLAIHLDRDVNKGLSLNPQQHLRPVWGLAPTGDIAPDPQTLVELLGAEIDRDPAEVLAFELMTYDLTRPTRWGWNDDFLSCARIDNLLSCWAAVAALADREDAPNAVIALFDHEEVGSVSTTGAASTMLADALGELTAGSERAAGSLCISADCAHGTHPNYPDRHDPDHKIALNGGPVIKINANERYATTATGHAIFAAACERAGVAHQVFVSRTDMACGSTVGPITAARTGLETVDVGGPQWAMHSASETTGSSDPHLLRRALTAIL